jgi:hypothetical protein
MAPLDKIIASYSPADTPSHYVGRALELAADLAHLRFTCFRNPEYREEAILRCRTYLDSISPEDPKRGRTMRALVELEGSRFGKSGVNVKIGLPELDDLPSFSHLASSLSQSNSDKSSSMTLEGLFQHIQVLMSKDRITNEAEIKEGVTYCRLLLASLDSLQKIPDDILELTYITLSMAGNFLFHAFKITNNPEYLNESIDIYRGILQMPRTQQIHFAIIQGLITSLMARFKLFNDINDHQEIMQRFPIAVTNTYAEVPDRFKVACQWAKIARDLRHPSTSTAYKNAISLLQDALVFSPTLESQHFHLVTMRDDYESCI